MIIKSNIKNYNVHMESNFQFISSLISSPNAYFVIDLKIFDLYKDELFLNLSSDKVFVLEALEETKVIETALNLCEKMTSLSAKKNIHLIAFGGGIIQDIAGFAANILYRGIKWTFVPTTLLAAGDSCIGSKTSLNYKSYKNLLGTFFPPRDIYICPIFFETLSEKDYLSGLGEIVKFNIIRGIRGLENLENDILSLINRNNEILVKYVFSSLEFKKKYIEADEFDEGVRNHLNFAHTFGHAIETNTNYEIPHGTAVALGMIMANRVSLKRGYLSQNIVHRIEKILRMIIKEEFLKIKLDEKLIIDAMKKDKKQTNNILKLILLKEVKNNDMSLEIYPDVQLDEINSVLVEYLDFIY